MKKRTGFVSNSSSSSFVITNKTNKDLTMVDFIKENPQFVEDFVKEYTWYSNEDYNQESILVSAELENIVFPANSSDEFEFDDSGNSMLHTVLHSMLTYESESESFEWGDYESHH